MEQLILLTQLAGCEPELVESLRAAGYRRAEDLAQAEVKAVTASGLPERAARRLIRAARELLEPAAGKRRAPRNALRALPGRPARRRAPASVTNGTASPKDAGSGVTRAETAALTGEEDFAVRSASSFWRFG